MLFLYRPEGGNRSLQITSCDNKQQNSSCFKTHGTYFQKLCFSSMRKYIYISFNVLFLNLLAKAEIIGMKRIFFSSKAVSVKQEHLHACIWGCTVRDRLFLISAGVETQGGFLTAVHLRWTQEAVLATWDLHPLRWVCGFPQTFNWVEGRKRTLHGRPPQEAFTVTTHGQCFSSCGDSQTVGLASCQTGQVVSASVKKKMSSSAPAGLDVSPQRVQMFSSLALLNQQFHAPTVTDIRARPRAASWQPIRAWPCLLRIAALQLLGDWAWVCRPLPPCSSQTALLLPLPLCHLRKTSLCPLTGVQPAEPGAKSQIPRLGSFDSWNLRNSEKSILLWHSSYSCISTGQQAAL